MTRLASRFGLLLIVFAARLAPAHAQTATIGYTWRGATNQDVSNTVGFFLWPPDTNGSVGINHYVQTVNGRITMFNKDGSAAGSALSESTFWGSRVGVTPGGDGFTDPRIYYDPLSRRWFAAEITTTQSGSNNKILIGRSDTSDPTGTWKGLTVNAPNGQFADFPTLAVDANGVYVGTNNFTSFAAGRSIISVPKASFLSNPTTTTPAVFTDSSNSSPTGFTPHGVTDTTGATVGLNSGLLFGTGYQFNLNDVLSRTIINTPAGTASLTTPTSNGSGLITVLPSNNSQAFAPQLGTTSTLDNGDNRNSSAIYRVGDLIYMARGVDDGTGNRSVARWTVLSVDNSTNAITVVREGTVDLGTGTHAFYPSIAANSRGDFVMSFSRSSSTEYPSIWAVVGTTSDHSNWSVGNAFQLQAGLTYQNIQGSSTGSNNRWGDYSSTTRDPADPGSFWVTNEYMHNVDPSGQPTAQDNWATQVVEVIPTIAGEVRWKNPAAGSFATAGNWATAAPSATDHVIFSRWSTTSYQVDLPTGTTTNDRLSIRQTGTGTVIFNIASGNTWSLTNTSAATPSLAISEFQGQSYVAFSGGGTLQTNHTIIAGQEGGTGNLTITGSGTTWINANDLFIGGTSTAAGGTGTLFIDVGASATVNGTATLWNSASAITVTGSSTLSLAGLTNASGTAPTVTVNANSTLAITDGLDTTYSGVIAGAGAVNKSGAGTFTLTGINTYSGPTTVSAGTLLVNGQSGSDSGTGTSAVTVTGGTLGGTGRVGGTVTVNNGASLAPGAGGIGTLTVAGNTTLNSGGKLTAEVAAPGSSDLLAIQGASTTIDFKTGSVLDLKLVSGFTVGTGGTYTLVSMPTGGGDNILLDGSTTTDGAVLGSYIEGTGTGGAVTIQPSGMTLGTGDQLLLLRSADAVVLQYSPVPEPGIVLAIAAGGLAIGLSVRRLRRREWSLVP